MNIKLSNEFLHQLVENTNSRKAVIFSNNGLSMFSTLDDNKQDENISAHTATMFDLCETSVKSMEALAIEQLIIENDNGFIITTPVNKKSYLVLFSGLNPDLSLIKAEMQKTISLVTNYVAEPELAM